MNTDVFISLAYIVSAVLFAFGLKLLGSPATARKGNLLSAIGMLLAVVVTLTSRHIIDYKWIVLGLLVGSALGVYAANRAKMIQMPEMVALLHGFGGLASVFVDWVAFDSHLHLGLIATVSIYLSILIGGITFTGSCVAWGKLSEKLPGSPISFPGQKLLTILTFLAVVVCGVIFIGFPGQHYTVFLILLGLSLLLGVLLVIPIGGADMPVVISVLNSYSGLVACTTGFVLDNTLLIVAGALVGANGVILSIIMCKAMNRSLINVLFGGLGSSTKKSVTETGEAKPISAEDAFLVLESAKSVVIVPGYGLAVAQAQHAVRELGELLEENGCDVKYAIHPVAGRMPGHMNVLLAEANVPYDQLLEMDAVNPTMNMVDVCIVIGANDVVNPAAREDEASPIYGMPVINVDEAKTVFVLKRSMASGFAGIENPLFYKENTRMIFGDAKSTVQSLVAEFKSAAE